MLRTLAGLLLLAGTISAQDKTPAAKWDGSFQTPQRMLEFILNLDKNPQGAWVGTVSIAGTPMTDLPLTNLAVDGMNVSFSIAPSPDAPAFKGKVSEDGDTFSGTIAQGGGTIPFTAKRAGVAKVVMPPKSSQVSADLAGAWEGSLTTPKGQLRVILHVERAADGTGSGKLESPDQGGGLLPVDSVQQDGQKFAFQSKLIGAKFASTLNADHTQMEGSFSQGGADLPLVLKKVKP